MNNFIFKLNHVRDNIERIQSAVKSRKIVCITNCGPKEEYKEAHQLIFITDKD